MQVNKKKAGERRNQKYHIFENVTIIQQEFFPSISFCVFLNIWIGYNYFTKFRINIWNVCMNCGLKWKNHEKMCKQNLFKYYYHTYPWCKRRWQWYDPIFKFLCHRAHFSNKNDNVKLFLWTIITARNHFHSYSYSIYEFEYNRCSWHIRCVISSSSSSPTYTKLFYGFRQCWIANIDAGRIWNA